MRDGSSLQKTGHLLPRNGLPPRPGKSAADDRFPRLSEECIAHLETVASAEFGKTAGRQVRFIRGLAVFLGR